MVRTYKDDVCRIEWHSPWYNKSHPFPKLRIVIFITAFYHSYHIFNDLLASMTFLRICMFVYSIVLLRRGDKQECVESVLQTYRLKIFQ